MTPIQRIIKYGAIAFGIYLCFVIISAIITGISIIFGISTGLEIYRGYRNEETQIISSIDEQYENIKKVDIKLDISRLKIKEGESFKLEVLNPTNRFYKTVEGSTLKLRDERNGWFRTSEIIPEVVIYIPKDVKLDEINIKAGVNETNIEKLYAENINIENGVGKLVINEIITDNLDIEGGAGETKILSGKIGEVKLQAGIGNFVIKSEIQEQAKLEAGVGNLEINLLGTKEDYKIKAETGIGNCIVNGQKVHDNQIIGDGKTDIKLEAGIGKVQVNFEKKD